MFLLIMSSKRMKTFKYQRRKDSSASDHCCVPQCAASARFNSVLSFHTFPKDKERRKKWVINIRRDNLTITNHTRVCSRHFQSADLIKPSTPTGRRLLKHGAVPVLFQWNSYTIPAPRPGVWPRREPPNADTATQNDAVPMDVKYHDHDYCCTPDSAAADLAPDHSADLRAEMERWRKQVEEMAMRNKFGVERFAASDDDIRFYTGFATYAHLMAFWSQIEPAAHRMVHLTGAQAAARKNEVGHTSNTTCLKPIDEFFLFMTYLSLGLMQKDLAHRFKIHRSTVSRIITTWANFLYSVLGAVGIWVSEEAVRVHLPEVFQDYSDTHVLLDFIELHCQAPDSLLPQCNMFSTYKSRCTFKGLIGMAPHGAVTFVSALYAGSIGDKEILERSGIMPLLKPSMAIMVDRGFLVEDCVPCKVYIPALLSSRAQLSMPEVRETQSITRLRVHVERLIRRVKEHKLFSTVIPLPLTGSVRELYTVACLLVNYQNGPLVKPWVSER